MIAGYWWAKVVSNHRPPACGVTWVTRRACERSAILVFALLAQIAKRPVYGHGHPELTLLLRASEAARRAPGQASARSPCALHAPSEAQRPEGRSRRAFARRHPQLVSEVVSNHRPPACGVTWGNATSVRTIRNIGFRFTCTSCQRPVLQTHHTEHYQEPEERHEPPHPVPRPASPHRHRASLLGAATP